MFYQLKQKIIKMSNRKKTRLSTNRETYLKNIFLKNYTVLLVEILSKLIFTGCKKEKKIIKLQPQAIPIK